MFAQFGIPATLVTDNGPQFDSEDMKEFAQTYEFHHISSSPYYPQVNELTERMVRTVKKLLEHSTDPYRALLNYRATPLPWCGLSPAELLMGRKIRTDIPQAKNHLVPKWEHIQNFRTLDQQYKQTQKENYNRRHRVRTLPELPENQAVWVGIQGQSGPQIPGQISCPASTPRSYIVETSSGELRRNRAHLRTRSDAQFSETADAPTITNYSRPVTSLQTGTSIRPPDRLRC